MKFLIYKITNLIDGKIYIGKHQTTDINDGYMGSGTYIRSAIAKYGIEKFQKEILFIFETYDEMNNKEIEIVNEEFIKRFDTYNIELGGQGSFKGATKRRLELHNDEEWYKEFTSKRLQGMKTYFENVDKALLQEYRKKAQQTCIKRYGKKPFEGQKHSSETIERIKEIYKETKHSQGTKNSQFGTCWVYNAEGNLKIKIDKLDEYLSLGYTKGRKMKKGVRNGSICN